MSLRSELINNFDNNSKEKGLRVPEHKCFCGKEAKYYKEIEENNKTKKEWFCKKHYL